MKNDVLITRIKLEKKSKKRKKININKDDRSSIFDEKIISVKKNKNDHFNIFVR